MNEQWVSVCGRNRVVRRVLFIAVMVVFFAVTATYCLGDDYKAVVRVGGCSGICVDPTGIVLTAKHCEHGPTETVFFSGSAGQARRVYVAEEVEGPVVFDCDGEGYPYIPLAEQMPEAGTVVSTSGYPAIDGERVFRRATGTLLKGGKFTFQGKPFIGNVTDMPLIPGWSGGPLFDERGEVCGLLSASNKETSVFITFTATRDAYEAARTPTPQKPTLLVFTTRNCTGCLAFKKDYESDAAFRRQLQSAFHVEFVDADLRADRAKEYAVAEVPTFVTPNVRINGYPGKQALIDRLLRPARDPGGIVQEPAVDWSQVAVVVLAAKQDVGAIRGAIRGQLLDVAVGPIQRRVAEATQGKAAIYIVAERNEPERFAAVARAAQVQVNPFFVLVLVTRQDLGLKGVILGAIENAVGQHLGNVPVDLIFERVHPDDYLRVLQALNGRNYAAPAGAGPAVVPGGAPTNGNQNNSNENFPVQETALGGILAALTERLQLIRKLRGWWERRKLK